MNLVKRIILEFCFTSDDFIGNKKNKYEKLDKVNVKDFEFKQTVLTTPVYNFEKHLEEQVDTLLSETHCLMTKLQTLINHDSHRKHIKHVCEVTQHHLVHKKSQMII